MTVKPAVVRQAVDVPSARAPGRVTIIGDHTDYTGGLVLPMAIQLGTTVCLRPGGDRIRLTSPEQAAAADVSLRVGGPTGVQPVWARYVAAVVADWTGIPVGRMGKAEEFAAMACFLCSDHAAFTTGTAINMDGGASPVV